MSDPTRAGNGSSEASGSRLLEAGTDDELLNLARAGNRQALALLLERHEAQVYRFGLKMCRDAEDAKDVLQETLLAMARGVREFRGASSLSTWLYTIARSYCIKKHRRSKFATEPQSLEAAVERGGPELADPAPPPDDNVAGKQVQHALEQAIAELEPGYREVLVLRDMEGLTAPEVAEVLAITPQAVKSRLHRARVSVRNRVAPLLGVPTDAPAAPGTCPDVLTLFSRHLEDEISRETCAEMERHLESCPRCRGTCDSLKRTLALCRTTGPLVEVPDSVQASVKGVLREFLDGT